MRRGLLFFAVLLAFLSVVYCPADAFAATASGGVPSEGGKNVVIKVRAVNPLTTKAKTEMKAYLPEGATPKDVKENDHFKFSYDKEKKCYYGTKEIKMKPKEVATGKIVLNDIWRIKPGELKPLEEKLAALEPDILKLPDPATAKSLYDVIVKTLSDVKRRETEMTIARVGAEKHIQEYRETLKMMQQAGEDLKVLDTLIRRASKATKSNDKKNKSI